jgi:pimeloyl-ACP methyl ester carboxylesterase
MGLLWNVSGESVTTNQIVKPDETLFWIKGAAGNLRVSDGGHGDLPILFVPGLTGNRQVWKYQLEHLRPQRRAIAIELRGHGESALATDGNYTVAALAGDLESAIDFLKLKRVVLAGHSLGGAVIATYAGLHPDRVDGLVFVDSVGDLAGLPESDRQQWLANFTPARFENYREEWFTPMLKGSTPEVTAQVLAGLRKTPQVVIAGCVQDIAGFSPMKALGKYRGPMIALVNPSNQQTNSLQNVIPGLKARVIAPAGHWIMLDQPIEVNTALDAFLQGLAAKQ